MNRTRNMILVIMVATALTSLVLTVYSAARGSVARTLNDCTSLRTMLSEEKAALNMAINPLGAYEAETRIDVYETDIRIICGDDKTPEATPTPSTNQTTASSPSPTPSVTATATATTDSQYGCRPTFYNDRDGKVGVYAFGAPVTQDTRKGVLKELKKRVFCDPALLVQESSKYNVPGVKGLNALERWELAKKLERQAKKDDQKAWDDLYNSFVAVLDSAKNELGYIEPGKYGSFQMVPGGKSGVPRVAALNVNRSTRQKVLRSTLPDGTVINLRLLCGFQPQVQKEKPDVPEIPDIPRDEEGTPKVKACNADTKKDGWTTKPITAPWTLDWSKCESPTPTPTPTPTVTPTPTPTVTPTPTPTSPSPTPTSTCPEGSYCSPKPTATGVVGTPTANPPDETPTAKPTEKESPLEPEPEATATQSSPPRDDHGGSTTAPTAGAGGTPTASAGQD